MFLLFCTLPICIFVYCSFVVCVLSRCCHSVALWSFCHYNKFFVCVNKPGNKAHSDSDSDHAKRKSYVNVVLWTKSHLKCTVSKWKSVLWSDESKCDILVGNHGRRVLRAKEEGDLPACHQHSVQKPASLMVWGCISSYDMGSLHVLEGTRNAERYIKV